MPVIVEVHGCQRMSWFIHALNPFLLVTGVREQVPLPPGEIRIGSRPAVIPTGSLLRKLEERGVTITVNDVEFVFPFVVVPLTPRIIFVAISPPRPIALNQFV